MFYNEFDYENMIDSPQANTIAANIIRLHIATARDNVTILSLFIVMYLCKYTFRFVQISLGLVM
jgi:hypothetical protein